MSKIKLRAGNFMIPVEAWEEGKRLCLSFGFNRTLLNEIKMMNNHHWHGFDEHNPRKIWSIEINPRNLFQLKYLQNKENPYIPYDSELKPLDCPPTRFHKGKQQEVPLFKHQPMMAGHMIQRGRPGCIIAGEMGTAKTLPAILALEKQSTEFYIKYGRTPEIWYVAPRVALKGVQRDFIIWGAKVRPVFMTYNELVKRMVNWVPGAKAPTMLIFDECSAVKTPTSQRAQAAKQLADGCRQDWPEDSMIVLMSGTPAPKSPVDWYWQAEIACPGFLKEGDIHKFKNVLGITIQVKGIDGVYPRFVTWRDDPRKCNICGGFQNTENHNAMTAKSPDDFHEFVPSVNEISRLHKRLKGLVEVYFKKDCLDLPDKHYKVIEIKPEPRILRAAQMILKSSATTIEGLTKLRELSDGFQYVDTKTGNKIPCTRCKGACTVTEYVEVEGTCPNCKNKAMVEGFDFAACPQHIPQRNPVTLPCPNCGQTGSQDEFTRTVSEVKCPKDSVLVDLLDEMEDIGRIVIFAGFTGSIDRVIKICHKQGWVTIRSAESKEIITGPDGNVIPHSDFLTLFQDEKETYPRVAFVSNPDQAMGTTLTASPMAVYFSNTFKGEGRMQSEDRIHRPSMDLNLGATIVDLIHLPSDKKVLENLKIKRDLQSMSLGEFQEDMKTATTEDRELVS